MTSHEDNVSSDGRGLRAQQAILKDSSTTKLIDRIGEKREINDVLYERLARCLDFRETYPEDAADTLQKTVAVLLSTSAWSPSCCGATFQGH